MNTFKKILAPIASLRITVVLLALAMILIFAGTLAQRETGIWEVKALYFNSWWVWMPYQHLVPFVERRIPGSVPFIGGKLLIILMLVNLLAAHVARFKLGWKRSGVLLIHASLIMLLAGELITNHYAVESQMPIAQGESTNWSQDIRASELVIADTSGNERDKVVSVPASLLVKKDAVVRDARLPFDVQVVKYYPNASLLGPMQSGGDALATAGDPELRKVKVVNAPTVSGTQSDDVDRAAAFVKLTKDGQNFGTYLLSVVLAGPQKVTVGDKTYDLALRFKRLYKPYTVTLLKFSHDKYPGSDMPRNFSSRIRLVDPKQNIDREHLIRMNEPLRYEGETFFQASFMPGDAGTVLQVVRNPGWMVPYIACVIGAVGMLIHFGIVLVGFLRRQRKGTPELVPFAQPAGAATGGAFKNVPASAFKSQGGKRGKAARDDKEPAYTLQPTSGWASPARLVPLAVAGLCLFYVVAHLFPKSYKDDSGLDLDTFARTPVVFDGRPMPMDSVARGTLKIMSGRESFKLENGHKVPAIRWLAEVLGNTDRSHQYKVVRIDHPQVKALLELAPEEKLFSLKQVMGGANAQRLEAQYAKLPPDSKTWDPYQKKVAELHNHVSLFVRFGDSPAIADLWDVIRDPDLGAETIRVAQAAQSAQNVTPEQEKALKRVDRWERGMSRVKWLNDPQMPQNKKFDLYFAAPTNAGEQWQGLGTAIPAFQRKEPVNATVRPWTDMIQALRDGRASDFNRQLAEYHRTLAANPPADAGKAGFETFFNRSDPFMVALVMYVGVFVFAALSWLGWHKPLRNTALAVAIVALVVHTFGLAARMYISGRPPVTNLYSSAVFIGWGAVILCLLLEVLFRRGIGAALTGAIGFGTLLVAGGLYVQQADQLGQLQAVLDTNFWLATHVTTITLGYSTMFIAGLLGLVYVAGGMLTTSFNADVRKAVYKMMYGILCFAMLLSFVGTILGGIWADQSWGRFWGWDPKENGAILIVLWIALILHARWAGLARERGVALLAIFGNIVTAWSWFGTNMLGVGLHAYGFMEGAVGVLILWVVFNLIVISIGNLPLTSWRSFAAAPTPPPVPANRARAKDGGR